MNRIKLGLLVALTMTTAKLAPSWPAAYTQAVSQEDINCLAKNIYHEARSEVLLGQVAVAQVTINRVKQSNFTKTVCEVVFAKNQFSWTSNRRLRVKDTKSWNTSLAIAKAVLTNSISLPNFNATHYHTKSIQPSWSRKMALVSVIGAHKFYN